MPAFQPLRLRSAASSGWEAGAPSLRPATHCRSLPGLATIARTS